MKRRELVQKIEEMGCILIRHGGKHDWHQNPRTRMARYHAIAKSTSSWPGQS